MLRNWVARSTSGRMPRQRQKPRWTRCVTGRRSGRARQQRWNTKMLRNWVARSISGRTRRQRKKKWKSKAAEVEYKDAKKLGGKKHKWKNAEAEAEAKVDAMRHRKKKWKSKAAEVEYKDAKKLG